MQARDSWREVRHGSVMRMGERLVCLIPQADQALRGCVNPRVVFAFQSSRAQFD